MSVINHDGLAVSRLATQYRESTNLISYIITLLTEANNLEQVFCDLLEQRWIDTAEGINLDIIGAIVGQSRIFINATSLEYFGFGLNPRSQSFGTLIDPGIGGRFKFIGEEIDGFRELIDEEYRLFIRARISRNSTSSTPEDIIAQIRFIFGPVLVLLTDGDTEYTISIGRRLSLNEKVLLFENDIVPKTAGVKATYLSEFDSDDFFALGNVPGNGGFGSLTNPNQGGKLGNLIF